MDGLGRTLDNLHIGSVTVESGDLTVTGDIHTDGTFFIDGGTEIGGSVTIDSTLFVNTVEDATGGTLTLDASTITLKNGVNPYLSMDISQITVSENLNLGGIAGISGALGLVMDAVGTITGDKYKELTANTWALQNSAGTEVLGIQNTDELVASNNMTFSSGLTTDIIKEATASTLQFQDSNGLAFMVLNGRKPDFLAGLGVCGLYSNTVIGDQAGRDLEVTSFDNVLIGQNAGVLIDQGDENIAIGHNALNQATGSNANENVAIGHGAGNLFTSGLSCVFLGHNTQTSKADATNSCAIGHDAKITADNQIVLGDTNVSSVITGGTSCNLTITGDITLTGGGIYGGTGITQLGSTSTADTYLMSNSTISAYIRGDSQRMVFRETFYTDRSDVDIGLTGSRFRNLYLSGDANIGGDADIGGDVDFGGYINYNAGNIGGTIENRTNATLTTVKAVLPLYNTRDHWIGLGDDQLCFVRTGGGLNSVRAILGNTSYFNTLNVKVNATIDGELILGSPTVPASASATGTTGQIAWASGFIYVCVANNTWQRASLATW